LGDGGGAVAFWEVCCVAVEGCSGGVQRQQRREMYVGRDGKTRLIATMRYNATTKCNDASR
jgi:hypothetical protein